MGRSRYYNQVDVLVSVADTGATVTSGQFNNFTTPVPNVETTNFLALTNSFYDSRESKTILSIDLDIGAFKDWSATNLNVRTALGGRDDRIVGHRRAHHVDHVARVQPPGDTPGAVELAQACAVCGDLGKRPARVCRAGIGDRVQDRGDVAHDLDLGAIDLVGVGHGVDDISARRAASRNSTVGSPG
jgi:hypothetical protein